MSLGPYGDIASATPLAPDTPLPPFGRRELVSRYIQLAQYVAKLKPASELNRDNCERLAEWQESHHPNCNVVHESSWGFYHPLGMSPFPSTDEAPDFREWERHHDKNNEDYDSNDNEEEEEEEGMFSDLHEQIRLVAHGAFRWVWMIREFDGTRRALKTLRVDSKSKNFDFRSFDRHRRDAVAMDELTSSPLIVDMYGFCSNTGIYDWGEGGDLESIFERQPDIEKSALLKIAYNVSLAIHDAHNFDALGRATMAHTDIKPDQFLYQDGYYRLTDFNRVRFLTWNTKTNEPCGFKVGKNGGNWRSPEEYDYRRETEKVDVYSLGNILYFMLTRLEPWADVPNKEVYAKVIQGERPEIPEECKSSDHPYDRYMIQAIKMAWTHDMHERPGALQIADKLKEGIHEIEAKTQEE